MKTYLESLDQPVLGVAPIPPRGPRRPRLKPVLLRRTAPTKTFAIIAEVVCAFAELAPEVLRGQAGAAREQHACHARRIWMALAVEFTAAPDGQIAPYVHRSRSCVGHSLTRLRELCDVYAEVAAELEQLRQRCRAALSKSA